MRCINTIQSYNFLIIHKFQRSAPVSDRESGQESVEEASHLGLLIILPESLNILSFTGLRVDGEADISHTSHTAEQSEYLANVHMPNLRWLAAKWHIVLPARWG